MKLIFIVKGTKGYYVNDYNKFCSLNERQGEHFDIQVSDRIYGKEPSKDFSETFEIKNDSDFQESCDSREHKYTHHPSSTCITSHTESLYVLSSSAEENDRYFYKKNFDVASEFLPRNGGSFQPENKIIKFINTCTVDYYLLIWVILSKTNKLYKKNLNELKRNENISSFYEYINKIVQCIVAKKWNSARLLWSNFICKGYSENSEMILYDYYGSEIEGYAGFHSIQTFSYFYKCTEKKCRFGNDWNKEELSGFSIS